MCISDIHTNCSKHIDLRHHYIRSLVEHNIVAAEHLPGTQQPTDFLTKPLGNLKFHKFQASLGLQHKE
jgi:hypothetical protein